MKRSTIKKLAGVLALVMFAVWTPSVWAYRDWDATPMEVEALVVRPFGIAATALGAAIFLVALPFAVLTGTTEQAANELVVAPYRFTFERPMGYPVYPHQEGGW
jgi:hypothetical protein